MVILSQPEIYEQEIKYMPWNELLKEVAQIIIEGSPQDGNGLDLMCGTGRLLGEIKEKREDIISIGIDINEQYITFAKRKYEGIEFIIGDILEWKPSTLYDFVTCDGGVHHLNREKQDHFIHTIPSMLKPGGMFIYGDSFIDDYCGERERKIAATVLGMAYFKETKKRGAPDVILDAPRNILCNDVNGLEFKTSLNRARKTMEGIFNEIRVLKVWPQENTPYGDYIIIAK